MERIAKFLAHLCLRVDYWFTAQMIEGDLRVEEASDQKLVFKYLCMIWALLGSTVWYSIRPHHDLIVVWSTLICFTQEEFSRCFIIQVMRSEVND